MAYALPGGSNGYVPSHESSNRLTVRYLRDPKSFPLLSYAKYQPTNKMVGYFADFQCEDKIRITDTSLAASRWADGANAPTGNGFGEKFAWNLFECERYAKAGRVGDLLKEQTGWAMVDMTAQDLLQLMMTELAQRMATLIQTTGNWPSANTADVATLATGTWEDSTTARSSIKKSIDYAIETIVLATGGAVTEKDLKIVFPRGCARQVSSSQEIRDYIKGSADAMSFITGEERDTWVKRAHGLPKNLYGLEVEVEDTVKVSTKRGQTVTRGYVFDKTKPFIVAKKIDGAVGSADFSTVSIFAYNGAQEGTEDAKMDAVVETKYDDDNKRTNVRVIQNTSEKLTAGASGFLFQGAVAA